MAESKIAEFKMVANLGIWVRMNELESYWIRFSQMCNMTESKMAEFKMVAIIKLIRWN